MKKTSKKEYEATPETAFRWAIYGISVGALFLVLAATYLIVRVADGNWASWQLPAILGIIFLTIVPISAMFTSLPDIKKEIDKEFSNQPETK